MGGVWGEDLVLGKGLGRGRRAGGVDWIRCLDDDWGPPGCLGFDH